MRIPWRFWSSKKFEEVRNFPYVHEFCAKRFSHVNILNTPSNMLPVSFLMNFVTFEQSTRKLNPNNSYAVWIGHTCAWGLANERPRSQSASNAPCKRRKYELCTHRRLSYNIPLHRALRRSGWGCWGTSFVVPNASEMHSLHPCYVVQMHCNDRQGGPVSRPDPGFSPSGSSISWWTHFIFWSKHCEVSVVDLPSGWRNVVRRINNQVIDR